jgi:phage host-nuclease inhibitor protein Gam
VDPKIISKELQGGVSKFLEEVSEEVLEFETKQEENFSKRQSSNNSVTPTESARKEKANQLQEKIKHYDQCNQKSEMIKTKVGTFLNNSQFAVLAKERYFLEKEIKGIDGFIKEIDDLMTEGIKLKRATEERFDSNYTSLEKVIEQLTVKDIQEFVKAEHLDFSAKASPSNLRPSKISTHGLADGKIVNYDDYMKHYDY